MKSSQQVHGIGFDFGRVLSNFNHDISLKELAKLSGQSIENTRENIFGNGLSSAHEDGTLSSSDFYQAVCSKLNITDLSEISFRNIWSSIFSPNPGISELLERLNPNIPRVVVSNTDPIHWQQIIQLPVMKTFFSDEAQWVLSFQVGVRKPGIQMYEAMCKRLVSQPEKVLYIDDIPEYVKTFRGIHGRATQYDCSKQTVMNLANILEEYGCLI